jgi:DNA-binding NarL/FixJ family response regulator
MNSTLRILTIDNHPLYFQGIFSCLKPLTIVESIDSCETYDEMLHKLKLQKPHLIFLELNLGTPRYDGFAICSEISRNYKDVFVAILTRYNSRRLIDRAYQCGARAFLDKNNSTESIHDFLHDFSRGKITNYYIKVSSKENPTNHFNSDGFELKEVLTNRECEVMQLIVDGVGHKKIESMLEISYETFRTHHKAILTKLNLENDVLLTKFAIQHKLTDETFQYNRNEPQHHPSIIPLAKDLTETHVFREG